MSKSKATEIPVPDLEATLQAAKNRVFWFDIQGAKLPSLQQADAKVRELEAELAKARKEYDE